MTLAQALEDPYHGPLTGDDRLHDGGRAGWADQG